jgi:hypothetical protein
MIKFDRPLIEAIPSPGKVSFWLGDALREVRLLRRLLTLAKLAEEYRACDRNAKKRGAKMIRRKSLTDAVAVQ